MAAPMRKRRILRGINYWLPVIIYAIFIFSVSSVPGKNIPSLFKNQDILFHFCEYTVFAMLISRAIKEYYPQKNKITRALLVLGVAIAYAFSDEVHQGFVPNRSVSFFDIMVDSIGSVAGCLLYR